MQDDMIPEMTNAHRGYGDAGKEIIKLQGLETGFKVPDTWGRRKKTKK
jgi:hypothetical protein